MGRFIVKLHDDKLNRDWYLEWSSVVDAPVTTGMSLEEFTEYYREMYSRIAGNDLPERLARVESKGTSSCMHKSLDDFLLCNRAGPGETEIGIEEIIERYCRNPKDVVAG